MPPATNSAAAVLQKEIDEQRATIQATQVSLTIGEIANMYREREITIDPAFQRLFRWSAPQKTRFIESIFLGIPIPSFFVAQREDGVWDVVDGVQRLSTILQFMELLESEDDQTERSFRPGPGDLLPSLQGVRWSGDNSLPLPMQLAFKRSKLDFNVILKESSGSAKFELFQRLNTGGTPLSPQEIRNAMLVASTPDFHTWLSECAKDQHFSACVGISEQNERQAYDMELALRFLLLHSAQLEDIRKMDEISEYLTRKMRERAPDFANWQAAESTVFQRTFELIAAACDSDAFRRHDPVKDRATGGFSITAFEIIALGVGHAVAAGRTPNSEAIQRVRKELWSDPNLKDWTGSGVRASTRIPKTVEYGRAKFE